MKLILLATYPFASEYSKGEKLVGSEVSPDSVVTNVMGEYHLLSGILVPLSLRLSARLDILKVKDHATKSQGKRSTHEAAYSFHLHP